MQKTKRQKLHTWYLRHQRDLPWRQSNDPYRIWISEVMLQQTTTGAVIAFYERFLQRFPTLKSLSQAKIEEIYEVWSGLGYYSRARNLHKAAQHLIQNEHFPRSYRQLIDLPGFGPYTARSVASLAFGEDVGVLDGNVIRILTRLYDLDLDWWKTPARQQLQDFADHFVSGFNSAEMNQAMMELGATVCLPRSAKCLICPLQDDCLARKNQTTELRPQAKPKRQTELWYWQPQIVIKNKNILIQKNDYAPFLKKQWFLPGQANKIKTEPKAFALKHTVTHHKIFIQPLKQKKPTKTQLQALQPSSLVTDKHIIMRWVPLNELKQWIPANLIHKAINWSLDMKSS